MRPEQFEVVSVQDPAFDPPSYAHIARYLEQRDEKMIPEIIAPGSTPTRYRIREIPVSLWQSFVAVVPEGEEQWWRAFRAGVVWVDGLRQSDGTRLDRFQGASGDKPMPEEVLNSRFRPSEVKEIGQVAWVHGNFPRWTDHFFVPPRSFQETLVRRPFPRADASPTAPVQSSGAALPEAATEKAPQPPTDHTSEPTASASVLPTAATAPVTLLLESA